MSKYVVGDIHGCFTKLKAVLDKVNFDSEKDILYSVGDLCDRGHENLSVLEYLYSLKNSFRPVFGNHDVWLYHYFSENEENECWLYYNGGDKTFSEIKNLAERTKKKYAEWLAGFPYMLRVDDKIITHNFVPFEITNSRIPYTDPFSVNLGNSFETGLLKDRDYDEEIYDRTIADFIMKTQTEGKYDSDKADRQFPSDLIFIMGHTPAEKIYRYKNNVYMIDTGAFAGGKYHLTLMNLDSMEIITD